MSAGRICGNIQKNYKGGYLFHLKEVINDKDCHGMFGFAYLFCDMSNNHSF